MICVCGMGRQLNGVVADPGRKTIEENEFRQNVAWI